MLSCRISAIRVALAVSVAAAMTGGIAQGRTAPSSSGTRTAAPEAAPPATCLVHSLPSFVAQGEFNLTATVADIVEVECNPYVYGTGSRIKITAGQLFSRCKGKMTWYVPNAVPSNESAAVSGRGVSVGLDADGNATVALLAGPECEAGEGLITAHMESEPFESFTTSFTVLPPINTPPGVFALPASQVEDSGSSAVATIIETEFRAGSEKPVRIASEELFARCRNGPKLHWIGMDGSITTGSEVRGVKLDNNGNAFVIAIGDSSCAEGSSLVEADLESKPFTTFTTNFTIQPPQPTEEPSFTIEKLQQIVGGASGFTSSPLKGAIGQTVDYKIVVKNTANVDETFSEFSDPHCDPGTIAGGPGSGIVSAGQATTYTCRHELRIVGSYTNEAMVTGTSAGGTPLRHTSNQVMVEVPPSAPAFTIEKLQKIMSGSGGFTTSPLAGALGQTVEYEIVVKNTGQEAVVLSNFTDAHCDSGTIGGGPDGTPLAPGASTTYTCRHLLTSVVNYVNEATVTGTAGTAPITKSSNQVEVNVPAGPGAGSLVQRTPGEPPTQPPTIKVREQCIRSPLVLRGASGPKRAPFTLEIGAQGIKQITFYLDGRKVKTLKQSQAKRSKFTIQIDPGKLAYGTHKVSIKTLMIDPNCASVSRSGGFIRPHTQVRVPRFPG